MPTPRSIVPWTSPARPLVVAARIVLFLVLACCFLPDLARAQANPGDPLFCQPNEGITFLIVNGGNGVFTSDADCYGNNIANDTDTTIATSQGGTLTKTSTPSAANYRYTPPTVGFTGLDTFPITVTTSWNAAGGPGQGGTSAPGSPATMTITLNVIPATVNLSVPVSSAPLVPVPTGSVSGCSAPGNSGQGPTAAAVYGCITRIKAGAVGPTHGTLVANGNTLLYTPAPGYLGADTFSYQAQGVNNDGSNALNSGEVTVQVSVSIVATPLPSTVSLSLMGLTGLGLFTMWRRRRTAASQVSV